MAVHLPVGDGRHRGGEGTRRPVDPIATFEKVGRGLRSAPGLEPPTGRCARWMAFAQNALAAHRSDPHLIGAMNYSVQHCASAFVKMTTVKRTRWHGSAWRRWSCAETPAHRG